MHSGQGKQLPAEPENTHRVRRQKGDGTVSCGECQRTASVLEGLWSVCCVVL